MNYRLKARIKKHQYGHLITEELLQQGEDREWLYYFGGRGLGCDLLPREGRRVSQSYGDLILDILRSRQTINLTK